MNNIPTAKHCIVKKKYLKVLQKLEVKKKKVNLVKLPARSAPIPRGSAYRLESHFNRYPFSLRSHFNGSPLKLGSFGGLAPQKNWDSLDPGLSKYSPYLVWTARTFSLSTIVDTKSDNDTNKTNDLLFHHYVFPDDKSQPENVTNDI